MLKGLMDKERIWQILKEAGRNELHEFQEQKYLKIRYFCGNKYTYIS